MTDLGAWTLYEQIRDQMIGLVGSLDPPQLAQTVPLTPGWTIADVVAHVCGLNADVVAGAREGLGSDERTSHQVESRSGQSTQAICDEWLGYSDAMSQVIDETPLLGVRLAADLVVHLHDVQHALGASVDRESAGSVSGGRVYAGRTTARIVEATGVALTIDLDGERFEPAAGTDVNLPALVLQTTPYDFLRSVTGRRSRREVLALDWSDDPAAVIDHLCPYGPLRSEDSGV